MTNNHAQPPREMSADVTGATLFSGFDGVGIGMKAAGISHRWGIEWRDDVAQVARDNGFHSITADILTVDPRTMERVDFLHASPPCTNASVANAKAGETELDKALAYKTAEFVEVLRPTVFTLENVWQYRNFHAFKFILTTLERLGYWIDVQHVNSADYGTIVLCPLHDLLCTHGIAPDAERHILHDSRTTASDIVATLAMMRPEDQAKFLAWDAVDRLVKEIKQDIAVNATWQRLVKMQEEKREKKTITGRVGDTSTNGVMSEFGSMEYIDENTALLLKVCLDAPLLQMKWLTTSTEIKQITLLKILGCLNVIPNICTNTMKEISVMECPLCKKNSVPQTRRRMILRARLGGWIPHLPDPVRWVGWYEAIEDLIPTLPESHFAPWQLERLPSEYQTILVAGVNGGTVEPEEPAQTVLSSAKTVEHRAFLVNPREMHGNDGAGYTAVGMGDPSYTVASSSEPNRHRAFLVNGALSSTSGDDKTLQIHESGDPGGTVVSTMSSVKDTRVFSNGRVVSMTPRALARFQSFPDWYELPTKKALACYGIGNAVPPLMMQRIYEQLTER